MAALKRALPAHVVVDFVLLVLWGLLAIGEDGASLRPPRPRGPAQHDCPASGHGRPAHAPEPRAA